MVEGIAPGLCECGCGAATNINSQGRPRRFLSHHQNRRARVGLRVCGHPWSRCYRNPKDRKCPVCSREQSRKRRLLNPERSRAEFRAYYEKNAEKMRARIKEWHSVHPYRPHKQPKQPPEKRLARGIVTRAMLAGKLVRPSICSDCGCPCTPDAHHHKGYHGPAALDVQWLCEPCHYRAHRKYA